MKIGIVGGGSIGLLFAAYLDELFSVTIYTRTPAQSATINEHGLLLHTPGHSIMAGPQAKVLSNSLPDDDLVIVAVKQYQLKDIAGKLSKARSLLFLQNGMSHLKLLPDLIVENIFVGTVEHGALKEGANVVRHNGEGITRTAVFKGSSKALDQFARHTPRQFPVNVEDDYYEMLSGKLAVNAVINPLTALVGVKNGELIENPYFENAVNGLFAEVADVLGFKDKEAALGKIKSICRNTAENTSSMLKDIKAGRRTEVDAILGYLIGEADRCGKEVPLLKGYYSLIKGLESTFREADE